MTGAYGGLRTVTAGVDFGLVISRRGRPVDVLLPLAPGGFGLVYMADRGSGRTVYASVGQGRYNGPL